MAKLNCWEVKKCGQQRGGVKVIQMGECPAATESRYNGLNGGLNGGRFCWFVAGTCCDGRKQGTYASKVKSCMSCEFYRKVMQEEGPGFVMIK